MCEHRVQYYLIHEEYSAFYRAWPEDLCHIIDSSYRVMWAFGILWTDCEFSAFLQGQVATSLAMALDNCPGICWLVLSLNFQHYFWLVLLMIRYHKLALIDSRKLLRLTPTTDLKLFFPKIAKVNKRSHFCQCYDNNAMNSFESEQIHNWRVDLSFLVL